MKIQKLKDGRLRDAGTGRIFKDAVITEELDAVITETVDANVFKPGDKAPSGSQTSEGYKNFTPKSVKKIQEYLDKGYSIIIGNSKSRNGLIISTNSRRSGYQIRSVHAKK